MHGWLLVKAPRDPASASALPIPLTTKGVSWFSLHICFVTEPEPCPLYFTIIEPQRISLHGSVNQLTSLYLNKYNFN